MLPTVHVSEPHVDAVKVPAQPDQLGVSDAFIGSLRTKRIPDLQESIVVTSHAHL
jgi:hypothetical protein